MVATQGLPEGLSGVRVLDTGRDAFLERAALIETAERAIHLPYYIWNSDVTGIYPAHRLSAAPARAVSCCTGFACAYATRQTPRPRTPPPAPGGPYSRWTRRHHLSHHFSNPGTNHGVTSPIWDLVFGTYVDHGRIRVPRRHAPPWLIDDQGRARDELSLIHI